MYSIQFFIWNNGDGKGVIPPNKTYVDYKFKNESEMCGFLKQLKMSDKKAYVVDNKEPFLTLNNPHLLPLSIRDIDVHLRGCYDIHENIEFLKNSVEFLSSEHFKEYLKYLE